MASRSRTLIGAALLSGAVYGLIGLAACDQPEQTPEAVEAPSNPFGEDFDMGLIASAWPMAVYDEVSLEPFSGKKGWVELVSRRNLATAVQSLGPEGGLPAARAHADTAALYRQAAMVSANALIETYGVTPKETDPVGVAHLLTVAYALNGDLDAARAQAAKLEGVTEGPYVDWHTPWKAWLDAGATWPPDLSSLPVSLPEVAVGGWPEGGELPHYSLPEQGEVTTSVDMGDPGALVALALWHDAAAHLAAGDQADVVDVYGARYRMPAEPEVTSRVDLPMEFLFGSDFGTAKDGAFVADLMGSKGVAAVDDHRGTSLLAALASASRVDGKVDAQRALDLAMELRTTYVDDLEVKAGSAHVFHRSFADVQMVGALRILALVAAAEGDEKAGGTIRINAKDRSLDEAACPVGLLSLAAWDAGNRYPLRGADIIHSQSRRYPSLEIARYALDVLSVRVGRESGTGGVGM